MISAASIQARIGSLLEQGSIPRSQCGRGLLQILRPMLDGGVIAEEPSGAGRRLVVRDSGALTRYSRQLFPGVCIPDEAGKRVAGVGRFRDSKAFASDTPEMVCVRAWRKGALLGGGADAGAAEATKAHGVFSFLLKPGSDYALRGACALVENPAVFTAFEQLGLPLALALFGRGRVSGCFLDWLVRQDPSDFTLAHLPDYDPAGLNEFERLRRRLGEAVQLHVPDDLEERFARFSNRELLARPNSRLMLAKLRASDSAAVRRVVTLMDRHNAGLEQESLFLHTNKR